MTDSETNPSEKLMTKIAINGATGRMGRRLLTLGFADSELEIVGALASPQSDHLGTDAGSLVGLEPQGVPISATFVDTPDIVVDFSKPVATDELLDYCLDQKVGLVMATTGLEPETIEKLQSQSHSIPIVWAPNTSLAVNLTMKLAQLAAKSLGDHSAGVDVEIIETHHRHKADSPSGTALKFGEIISKAMGELTPTHGRHGMLGERPRNEIGYHAVRAGDDPGQHTILFGMPGEKIELKVAASNRDCYAAGALSAAKFLVQQGPGLYSMFDVLGL